MLFRSVKFEQYQLASACTQPVPLAGQPALFWVSSYMSMWSNILFNCAVLINLIVAFFYPFVDQVPSKIPCSYTTFLFTRGLRLKGPTTSTEAYCTPHNCQLGKPRPRFRVNSAIGSKQLWRAPLTGGYGIRPSSKGGSGGSPLKSF